MNKIIKFLFIVAVMLACYFACNILLSPVLEQILYEGVGIVNEFAMMIYSLIVNFIAAVAFIILYVKWYIAVPEHKRDFLKRMAVAEYSTKPDITYHMEEYNGNADVVIYMAYSALFPLSILLFGGTSPISFLYFHQLIFYTYGFTASLFFNVVFSYTVCIIFFIGVYILGVIWLHKRWYKNRLRKNIDALTAEDSDAEFK